MSAAPVQTPKQKELTDKVIAWLEGGAPHTGNMVGFSMHHFCQPVVKGWLISGPLLKLEYVYSVDKENYDEATCGTVHCIGGAIIAFAAKRQKKSYDTLVHSTRKSIEVVAGNLIGMTSKRDAYEMFLNWNFCILHPTPQQAAHVLRTWQETGIVDWTGACDV